MPELIRTLETLELVGGVLCLDFANTVNSRPTPEHEYLMEYSDLLKWARKLGALSPTQASKLEKRASQFQDEAGLVLSKARRMRELLYVLFSRTAKGTEPAQKDIETLVRAYGETVSQGQFTKEGNRYRTTWKMEENLDAVLWPIIHSAAELLQSDELEHVKECPGCGWLFLDTSKNQSRRWCSMNTCGSRDKMRRYHKKQRTK